MVHHDASNDTPPFRDTQTVDEVRFLIQGLRQLAIDPHAEVPAHFRVAILDKARQLPPPRPRPWDWLGTRLTVWTPVFAVGLLLSLGVHLWQGLQPISSRPPAVRQTAEQRLEQGSRTGLLSPDQWHIPLHHTDTLRALIATRPVPQAPRAMVGFTPHTTRRTFVRMGILYADVLAALRSGAVDTARHRLDILTQTVTSLQAPPALALYLQEMQAMLQRQLPSPLTAAQFVALFEPLYTTVYATDPSTAAWVFFRAGTWLENLSLAAAVGDQTAVRQAQAVSAVQEALHMLAVPESVLDALTQLRTFMERQPMMAEDLRTIQTLVDTIAQQLST